MAKDQPTPQVSKGAETPAAPQPDEEPLGLPLADDDEEFEEDFTNTEEGYPMVEAGAHHAKVIDFEKSDSQAGNPQYVWQFRITAGPSKDMEIRNWTSLLPQARWRLVEALTAMGIAAQGSIAKFRKSEILGKPCILEVVHETYQGTLQHKVKKVHPPDKDSVAFAASDTVPF